MNLEPIPPCRCARPGNAYMNVRSRGPGELAACKCCLRCLGYLPMGESNDVAVEVRAANLGDAGFGDWRPIAKSTEEVDGLIAFERDRDGKPDMFSRSMWGAGWLAGAIIFHDREQMAESRDRAESALRYAASEFLGGMGEVVTEVRSSIEPAGVRLPGQR